MTKRNTLGTCGNCGGPVTIEIPAHALAKSIREPSRCDQCGVRDLPWGTHGPVLKMIGDTNHD